MNARDAFNRSEAALEYRPVPARDGTYSWYWILLALPHETHLASGTALNRAQASAQARLKARRLGRRIASVRVAGTAQEAKPMATAKNVISEAVDVKDFIEQTENWEERLHKLIDASHARNVVTYQAGHDREPAFYLLRKEWPTAIVQVYLRVWEKAATQTGTICRVEVRFLKHTGAPNRMESDWDDDEHWYGDMNVFLDRLEPIWHQVLATAETPDRTQVQQWFSGFLRWLYENPGELKI